MEPANIVLLVMISWCGMLFLLVGYLVKKNKSLETISFPNIGIEEIGDKAGFSRFVGNHLMLVGVVALFTALSVGLLPQFTMLAILLFIISILGIMMELAMNKKRYL